jgi:hypothetical protein
MFGEDHTPFTFDTWVLEFVVSTKCIDPWVLEFVVSTKCIDPWILEFMVSIFITETNLYWSSTRRKKNTL